MDKANSHQSPHRLTHSVDKQTKIDKLLPAFSPFAPRNLSLNLNIAICRGL